MKVFLSALALAITFLPEVGGPMLLAQQTGQDPTPPMPHKTDTKRAPQQNEPQMPASGEITTQEIRGFSGRVVEENGQLVLKDLVTKVTYKLSNQQKAKHFIGKNVKVTGKLDQDTNTIQVESMESSS